MQQIQDLQKGKEGQCGGNKRAPYSQQKCSMGGSNSFPQNNSPPNNHNLMKNAQHTALTLLLASQMGQNGMDSNNGSNNQMSLQNQQLLAALQAMSKGGGDGGDQFLNGIPGQHNNGQQHNLSNLLGLASPSGNSPLLSPQGQHLEHGGGNIPHHFYPPSSQGLSSPGGSGSEDHWSSPYKSSNRSTPVFGSSGMHKVGEVVLTTFRIFVCL